MTRNSDPVNDELRIDHLPGVGRLYEIATTDGRRLSVVIDRRGDRHISVRAGRHADDPSATAVISARLSSLLALVLSDTLDAAHTAWSGVAARPKRPPPRRNPGGPPRASMGQVAVRQ